MSASPIACKLTSDELRERRTQVLGSAARAIQETREQQDGFSFRFASDDETYEQVSHLVNLERKCCPFLRFRVTAEPEAGPLWLEVTGPEGAKELIAMIFDVEA